MNAQTEQVEVATGDALDRIAILFGVQRIPWETDVELRAEILRRMEHLPPMGLNHKDIETIAWHKVTLEGLIAQSGQPDAYDLTNGFQVPFMKYVTATSDLLQIIDKLLKVPRR